MTGAGVPPRRGRDRSSPSSSQRVQPDAEMRAYLARLTGHALEGRVVTHVLPIHYGAGANGKSTYIDAVMAALGDYADAADPELLTARTFDAHPTGIADLFGLRLAILHESDHGPPPGRGAPSSGSPEATGSRPGGCGRTSGRSTRRHTFAMLTNHKPVISGTDEGDLARGSGSCPWDVVIPEAERDELLGDSSSSSSTPCSPTSSTGYQAVARTRPRRPRARSWKATEAYRAESDALAGSSTSGA